MSTAPAQAPLEQVRYVFWGWKKIQMTVLYCDFDPDLTVGEGDG